MGRGSVRRAAWVVAVALVAAFAAGAAPWASAHRVGAIRLAYTESIYSTTSVVAIEKGFFAEEGLVVNAFPEPYGGLAVQGIIGGSVHFGVASNARFLTAASQDFPVVAVGITTYGFQGAVVVPVSDTRSRTMRDLVGKSIGVQMGSGTAAVWLRYLEYLGLSERDFTIRNMDTEKIPAAFEAKALDAAVPWEPFARQIVNAGLGRYMLRPQDIAGPVGATYAFPLLTSRHMIEEHADVVQRFLNAWAKALKFIHENPEETAAIMQAAFFNQGLKLTQEQVRELLGDTRYDRVTFNRDDVKDTAESARIYLKAGRIRKMPNLEAFVEERFARRAAQLVGWQQ